MTFTPIDRFHVLQFPDVESSIAFSTRLMHALHSEEGTRRLAEEPRAVVFSAPIMAEGPRDRDLYASDGALELARANGIPYRVLGVIQREQLPPFCTLLLGLNGDAEYGQRD